jgi:hypothetical protein
VGETTVKRAGSSGNPNPQSLDRFNLFDVEPMQPG